jgi:predicted nucleic acid-binding protein
LADIILLDSGPLGRLVHPHRYPETAIWVDDLLSAGATVTIPEIVDYELRRNLLLERFTRSVVRLDHFKAILTYFPLNTDAMLRAAELWAEARRRGTPTAAPGALDADVILAAQALQVGGIVATDNVRHLSQFVDARLWTDISVR